MRMDAIELLKRDHDFLRGLLARYQDAGVQNAEERARVMEEFARQWLVHERVEEDVFYPAYHRATAEEEEVGLLAARRDEHEALDELVDTLGGTDINSRSFNDTMSTLQEQLDRHIRQEEEVLFTKARNAIGGDMDAIGNDILLLRDSLLGETRDEAEARESRLMHGG